MLKCISGRWRAQKWIPVNISKVRCRTLGWDVPFTSCVFLSSWEL
ncbi:hypothetical protein V1478_007416 [Vespula squamosa]|uniref:Uncharacterized protein n=1 Tax=Vespula squamosa TaxID=30214 RepID=A0ABD2B318_VESSQ